MMRQDSAMHELWGRLHFLFDTDDGSLPDAFVENLTGDQVCTIYKWVRLQSDIYCSGGEPTYWDRVDQCDVPIRAVEDPAQLVVDGLVEPFRHGLERLIVFGAVLPQLSICAWPNQIHFDYRMGSEWGPPQLSALFEFLWIIQRMAPDAEITHAHEGDSNRTFSFSEAWRDFRSIQSTRKE